jgi:uncharacterized protein (UPF0297 family)
MGLAEGYEGLGSAPNDRARRAWTAERARAVSRRYRWDELVQEFVKVYYNA